MIHFAGALLAFGIDGVAYLDLCIDSVIGATLIRLKVQGADRTRSLWARNGLVMRFGCCKSHWLGICWLDLASAANQLINGPNGTRFSEGRQHLCAWVRSWHPGLPEMLREAGQRPRAWPMLDLAARMLSRSRTVKS